MTTSNRNYSDYDRFSSADPEVDEIEASKPTPASFGVAASYSEKGMEALSLALSQVRDELKSYQQPMTLHRARELCGIDSAYVRHVADCLKDPGKCSACRRYAHEDRFDLESEDGQAARQFLAEHDPEFLMRAEETRSDINTLQYERVKYYAQQKLRSQVGASDPWAPKNDDSTGHARERGTAHERTDSDSTALHAPAHDSKSTASSASGLEHASRAGDFAAGTDARSAMRDATDSADGSRTGPDAPAGQSSLGTRPANATSAGRADSMEFGFVAPQSDGRDRVGELDSALSSARVAVDELRTQRMDRDATTDQDEQAARLDLSDEPGRRAADWAVEL